MITIQVIFRVFDRDAFEEFAYPEIPMVYCIKRRVKLLTGNGKRNTDYFKGQQGDTTIFKEIIIDNGKRMWIYKYLRPDQTRNKTRRYSEQLVRTEQTI